MAPNSPHHLAPVPKPTVPSQGRLGCLEYVLKPVRRKGGWV